MRFLVRRRVIEADPDPDADTLLLPDDLTERGPSLAQLAAAAVSGLPPAGPELRRKPLKLTLPTGSGPKIVRPLCVESGGFSLHAATRAGAENDLGRENLFKYGLRPPIAQEHVTLTADGLVALKLKRPFRDGTVSVEMDPLSLISRLAASVHPPRFHSVRHGGVLAPRIRVGGQRRKQSFHRHPLLQIAVYRFVDTAHAAAADQAADFVMSQHGAGPQAVRWFGVRCVV